MCITNKLTAASAQHNETGVRTASTVDLNAIYPTAGPSWTTRRLLAGLAVPYPTQCTAKTMYNINTESALQRHRAYQSPNDTVDQHYTTNTNMYLHVICMYMIYILSLSTKSFDQACGTLMKIVLRLCNLYVHLYLCHMLCACASLSHIHTSVI